jgi:hypothetical protein
VEVVEFFERRRITARGVDVVEGTVTAPITVTLHDQRISVSQSAHGSVIVRAEALLEGADSVTYGGEFCAFWTDPFMSDPGYISFGWKLRP